MRNLKFTVSKQILTQDPKCDFSGLICGTKGYLQAVFKLDQEWSGCKIAASFRRYGKEYAVPVINGRCMVPDEAAEVTAFEVSLTGLKNGYKITTNRLKVVQK